MNETMTVPFISVKPNWKTLKNEILKALGEVVEKGDFILGEFVEDFEKRFAAYCGTRYALGVSSGTTALHLALLALGIGPGDEVITVSNTFIATAEAIHYVGARPIFVDIDRETYTIDCAKIRDRISERTKAILPVHLYGQVCEMDKLLEIAAEYDLKIIEDACQAHGAEYKGKKAGSFGDLACFSFYPTKNLGAIGEAGAILTNNEDLCKKIIMLRNHGQVQKDEHHLIGYNARMSGIQGAALTVKLDYLDRWNAQRRQVANQYNKFLDSFQKIATPVEADYRKHTYHLYVIQCPDGAQLKNRLAREGIDTRQHYPKPIHLQKAFSHLHHEEGSLPITEDVTKRVLSLPMHPGLPSEEIQYVSNAIRKHLSD
ncbi:MAG: DegT/DnrJ/EryC1/StrS family aminotransferase [Candidatus Heimdallarchaeota archaeon]